MSENEKFLRFIISEATILLKLPQQSEIAHKHAKLIYDHAFSFLKTLKERESSLEGGSQP